MRTLACRQPSNRAQWHTSSAFRSTSGRRSRFTEQAARSSTTPLICAIDQLPEASTGVPASRRPSSARRRRRRSSRAPGRRGRSSDDSLHKPGCGDAAPCARARTSAWRRRHLHRTAARRRVEVAAALPGFSGSTSRRTGEVRCGCDVTISTAPLPRSPRRASSLRVTRRKCVP